MIEKFICNFCGTATVHKARVGKYFKTRYVKQDHFCPTCGKFRNSSQAKWFPFEWKRIEGKMLLVQKGEGYYFKKGVT